MDEVLSKETYQAKLDWNWSHNLVVMGGDSRSCVRIPALDTGLTLYCCKICNVCLEKTENKTEERLGLAHFKSTTMEQVHAFCK